MCRGFELAHVTTPKPGLHLCMTGRGECSGNCRREGGEGKEVGVNGLPENNERIGRFEAGSRSSRFGRRLIQRYRDPQKGLVPKEQGTGRWKVRLSWPILELQLQAVETPNASSS